MIKNLKQHYRLLGLRGFFYALLALVFRIPLLYKIKRKKFRFPFYLRVATSDLLTYRQIFIKKQYGFRVVTQPKVIIDAGANIGLTAIYFANKFPDAKIIAIEPELSNFTLLKKNCSGYGNIIPLQAALWHSNEEINLFDPGFGNWGFVTEMKNSSRKISAKTCHSVQGITVDKLISDYQLGKIDILKVDIEGGEKEVFADTSQWIEKVDAIIIELHERMKAGCESSFYAGAKGFTHQWHKGENLYLSRGTCVLTKAMLPSQEQ